MLTRGELPAMATEVVAPKLDVIVAVLTAAINAASRGDLDHPDRLLGRRDRRSGW